MKFIKTYSGFTIFIAILYFSLGFLPSQQNEVEQKIIANKGDVAPQEEWKDILSGKWKFQGEASELTKIHIYTGDVAFYEDSIAAWNIHYKQFSSVKPGAVRQSDEYLNIVGGTTRVTNWDLEFDAHGTIFWQSNNYNCQDYVSYNQSNDSNIGLCSYFILGKWGWGFNSEYDGRLSNGISSKVEIIQFNKEKIVIYEKSYGSDTENYFTLERVE